MRSDRIVSPFLSMLSFDGATCSHTDNGEDVTSSVSLLVVDVQLDGGDEVGTSQLERRFQSPFSLGLLRIFLLVSYLFEKDIPSAVILEEDDHR